MGIGEAIAVALAKEGVNVALLSRSKVNTDYQDIRNSV